jgi:serine/threonine protein kinase
MREQDSASTFDVTSMALLIAAGALLGLASVPGFPTLPFNALAVVLWFTTRLMKRPESSTTAAAETFGGEELKLVVKAPTTSASLLDELLGRWQEQFDRNVDLPAEELCKECPEMTKSVKSGIRSLKRMSWLKASSSSLLTEKTPLTGSDACFEFPLAGRYRMERRIGKGGFGEVWLAFDLELQRPVAVKVPRTHRHQASNEEAFQDEARKVAKLKHPGIIQVYDVGRADGMYFIVSDFIDGHDLAALLSRRHLSWRESVRIVAEAARSLQYAHEHGFIHRDIKPANILIDRHSKVYLADFGIAATSEQLRLHGDDGRGTLAYMSPEQLHGDPSRIDARSDLYGLGVVLYELLTRQHPFAGKSRAELQECVLNQEPAPPRSMNRRIPREVERICLKCLSKSPVNRYASAAAFADALAHSQRSRWRWRGNSLVAAAVLFLVGLLGVGAWRHEEIEVPEPPKKGDVPTIVANIVSSRSDEDRNADRDLDRYPKNIAGGGDDEKQPPPGENRKSAPKAAGPGIMMQLREVLAGADWKDLSISEREIALVLMQDRWLIKNKKGILERPRVETAQWNAGEERERCPSPSIETDRPSTSGHADQFTFDALTQNGSPGNFSTPPHSKSALPPGPMSNFAPPCVANTTRLAR